MSTPPRPRKTAPPQPAFGAPRRPPPAAPKAPSQPLVEEPAVDAALFQPDPGHEARQQKKTPATRERAEIKVREQALLAVASMQRLAPLVTRAMAQEQAQEQQVACFARAVSGLREKARDWARRWGASPEDEAWVTAALEAILAAHPSLADLPDLGAFAAALPSHLPPPPARWLPLEVAAPVALMEALAPVASIQAIHGLGRHQPHADLAAAARLLAEAGQDAILELVDAGADTSLRTAVFAAVVAASGQVLAALWQAHAQALQEQRRQRSLSAQALHDQAHPDGEDIQPIFQAFVEHAARLRRLARIARPKA